MLMFIKQDNINEDKINEPELQDEEPELQSNSRQRQALWISISSRQ